MEDFLYKIDYYIKHTCGYGGAIFISIFMFFLISQYFGNKYDAAKEKERQRKFQEEFNENYNRYRAANGSVSYNRSVENYNTKNVEEPPTYDGLMHYCKRYNINNVVNSADSTEGQGLIFPWGQAKDGREIMVFFSFLQDGAIVVGSSVYLKCIPNSLNNALNELNKNQNSLYYELLE